MIFTKSPHNAINSKALIHFNAKYYTYEKFLALKSPTENFLSSPGLHILVSASIEFSAIFFYLKKLFRTAISLQPNSKNILSDIVGVKHVEFLTIAI